MKKQEKYLTVKKYDKKQKIISMLGYWKIY